MNWTYAILALMAGALLPLQALVNARLGHNTTGGLFASTCSFIVGTIALSLVLTLSRQAMPNMDQMLRLPLWMWVGGLLGATFVVIATLAIPRLGASTMVALIILGQMLGSLTLDYFGVLQAQKTINIQQIGGAVLIMAGVLLVLQPWNSK